jgi:ribosomal-protein-alanine N-acetyltransferase
MRDVMKADLEALLAIEEDLFQSEAWSKDVFESEFALLGVSRVYKVLENEGEIVGYFGLAIIDGVVDITTIAVTSQHQRLGLGTMMMNEILEISKQRGAQKVMLEVKPENLAAITLYQKFGFEVIGLRRNYYGPSKDALTMQRLVTHE